MAQAAQLSPALTRSLAHMVRALLAAARNWSLYPPQHPALAASIARLGDAIRDLSSGSIFSCGITPETLVIGGAAADASQPVIAEAATFLHQRDLVAITFVGDVPADALPALLRLLSLDASERRSRGGPAAIWQADGHASIVLEQIDYARLLAREERADAEPARRDGLWRSIVASLSRGRPAFDEDAERRLLAIAGSPADITDLATAVMEPRRAPDGSPMITSQAAAVLAAFRHLTGIVSVTAPERLPAVMSNLAAAAVQLDPHVTLQLLQQEDGAGVAVVRGLAAAFDDTKVARLLATALALDGKASDRLATIFGTIVQDDDRKRRVLALTRTLLQESDFGRSGHFQALWSSMEELLVSYDEKPFVSEAYRATLDGIGSRADRMAAVDLPPELPEWIGSLGEQNVRSLSVAMLVDLLALEQNPARAGEIAGDMEALAEDLLMAGAFDDGRVVVRALAGRAAGTGPAGVGADACRRALDALAESPAMREIATLLGDLDTEAWTAIQEVVKQTGAAAIEALKPVLAAEPDDLSLARVEDLAVSFGAAAVPRLAPLLADSRWFVQRRTVRLLRRLAAAEAVPLLQPLLRAGDPRVAREAISALAAIPDPAAARAIHTVLRAATGDLRRAIVDALVALRDARVVPMLVRILEESEPLGADHGVALETIRALGQVGTDQAVPVLTAMSRRRAWFGRRRRLRALKQNSIAALTEVGGPKAEAALRDAAHTGDRMLRKLVAGLER